MGQPGTFASTWAGGMLLGLAGNAFPTESAGGILPYLAGKGLGFVSSSVFRWHP